MTNTYEPGDLEYIAHVCHEANRALQVLHGEDSVSPHWGEAPEWQIESALEGVQRALDGETPEQLHESWCTHKVSEGWTYGDWKDPELKTHPCLVPYSELPPEQRVKDTVFHAIVRVLTSQEEVEHQARQVATNYYGARASLALSGGSVRQARIEAFVNGYLTATLGKPL